MTSARQLTQPPITLTVGSVYDTDRLACIGWRGPVHDGYHWLNYFDAGEYLGPDEHGVEPIVAARIPE